MGRCGPAFRITAPNLALPAYLALQALLDLKARLGRVPLVLLALLALRVRWDSFLAPQEITARLDPPAPTTPKGSDLMDLQDLPAPLPQPQAPLALQVPVVRVVLEATVEMVGMVSRLLVLKTPASLAVPVVQAGKVAQVAQETQADLVDLEAPVDMAVRVVVRLMAFLARPVKMAVPARQARLAHLLPKLWQIGKLLPHTVWLRKVTFKPTVQGQQP